MKQILTNLITDPNVQQPFTGPSLAFLQAALSDQGAFIGQSLVGDSYSGSACYMAYGGRKTGAIIANGFVFMNGEWYFMVGADTTAYSHIPVIILNTAYDAQDPVLFSDGTTKSVHQIRTLKIVDQLTGTGLCDYANVIFLQPTQITVGSGGTAPAFGTNWAAYTQPTVFRKNKEGLVTIQGSTLNSTNNTGTIFTLPVGFRPSVARVLKAMVYYDTTYLVLDILSVNTTGVITILGLNAPMSFTNTIVYFDVSFYAD